jgi:hypothetical protein
MEEPMKNKQQLPGMVAASLCGILDYLWEDEKRNYEAEPNNAGPHIFLSLKAVADWLDAGAEDMSRMNLKEE